MGLHIRRGVMALLALGLATLPACGPNENAPQTPRTEIAQPAMGEAFGELVPADRFQYYYNTSLRFTRSGKESRTEDEIRQEAWQNLIFVHEADRLGLTVSEADLTAELERLVDERGVAYGSAGYQDWVLVTFKEEVEVFERRIEDLLKINVLTTLKMNPTVTVTEEDIRQKFLNQYNSFESEYIHFESREDAQTFLEQVQVNPAIWKDTFDVKRAESGQQGAAWINTMSMEALIDLWKIPTDDAYAIHSREAGSFIVGGNYYGDAVFRLLRRRSADMEKYTEQKQASYRKMLTTIKTRKIAKAYFEDLLARADYRDYASEHRDAEAQTVLAAKIERLKEQSSITIKTTEGVVTVRLWPEVAPKASENFITLVEEGFYDGLIFHRVKKDFMIQGGDPTGTGQGGESIWGEPFEDEVKEDVVFDRPGLLAMANTGRNTNQSQFFITTVPTAWLNGKHTIFGEVTSGLDVVKRIEGSPVDSSDKPLQEQKILKASIL